MLLRFSGIICIFFFSSSFTYSQKIGASEPTKVPNTSITITPPEHFMMSNQFSGFIHAGTGSTILIQEKIGIPFVYYKGENAKENFESQGVTLVEERALKTNLGKPCYVYVLSFKVIEAEKEIVFERILLLTGDYNNTIVLNANYPVMVKEVIFEVLMNSLLSVEF